MCLDPVFQPHKCRPGFKVRLHDAETFLYPPSSFADFQDGSHIIVQQVGTYSIQPVISGFFLCLFFIQIILDAGCFAVLCGSHLSHEPGRVIRVLPFCLSLPGCHHFFGAFHLSPADLLLISGIFGGVGDDQPLVQLLGGIRAVFIEKAVFFRVSQ